MTMKGTDLSCAMATAMIGMEISKKKSMEKECTSCGTILNELNKKLYEYKGNLYCYDCLLSELEEDEIITTNYTIHYYLNDEWIGDDGNLGDVFETILSNYEDEIKVVKE